MIVVKNAVVWEKGEYKEKRLEIDDGESIIREYERFYVFPGFVDSHIHLVGYGETFIFPDLSNAESKEDAMERIFEGLSVSKYTGFLYAFGLKRERIEITSKDLDKISKKTPIILRRIDGHSVYLNQKAREFLGISYKEEYKGEDNTKIIKEVEKRIPEEIKEEGVLKAEEKLLSHGVTHAVSMTSPEDVEFLLKLKDRLNIEITIFPETQDIRFVKKLGLPRIGGCIRIDGLFASHTAALSKNYQDENTKGILYFSDEELERFIKEADREGLQLTFHAIGDRAVKQLLSIYEKVIEEKNPKRHRIEHAELLFPRLLERIKRLEVILSMQPAFELYWGGKEGMYEKRLGERKRYTNPFKTLFQHNIKICFGSDAPITEPIPSNVFKGCMEHPNPEERISFKEAITAYTENGAYAVGWENKFQLFFSQDFSLDQNLEPEIITKNGKVILDRTSK